MEYVIGIDGGGTRTTAIAVDLSGSIIESFESGASNPQAISFDTAVKQVFQLISNLFADTRFPPKLCRGICMGLAGVSMPEEQRNFQHAFEQRMQIYDVPIPVKIVHDAEIALMAGHDCNSGVIAISGTGSIVYGITPDKKRYRAGGWGHILGDNGSGYEIGLSTIRSVMSCHDGLLPDSQLVALTLEKHGFTSAEQLRSYIYQPFITKRHIAEYAQLCIQAARKGDRVASRIIQKAAADVVQLTLAVLAKDEWFERMPSPIVVCGSIFQYSELYLKTFTKKLSSRDKPFRVILGERPPAYGAARLILQS